MSYEIDPSKGVPKGEPWQIFLDELQSSQTENNRFPGLQGLLTIGENLRRAAEEGGLDEYDRTVFISLARELERLYADAQKHAEDALKQSVTTGVVAGALTAPILARAVEIDAVLQKAASFGERSLAMGLEVPQLLPAFLLCIGGGFAGGLVGGIIRKRGLKEEMIEMVGERARSINSDFGWRVDLRAK